MTDHEKLEQIKDVCLKYEASQIRPTRDDILAMLFNLTLDQTIGVIDTANNFVADIATIVSNN